MIKKSFKTFLYLIATFLILAQSSYALNLVELSPGYYPNSSRGRALSSADIYVGKPDLDPEIVANQKQLSVQQEDGTIVAVTQPISTGAGGVPQYAGSPVVLLVEGDYSLKVLDSSGVQVYYVPSTAYEKYLIAGNYYYPDYAEADQGVAGGGETVTDILADVGAVTNATMYFSHNSGAATTTYTVTTNTTITNNFNIIIEDGAILDGAGTLTTNGPFQPGRYQVFGSSLTVAGSPQILEAYPEWFGIDGTADQTEINKALDFYSVVSFSQDYSGTDSLNLNAKNILHGNGYTYSGVSILGVAILNVSDVIISNLTVSGFTENFKISTSGSGTTENISLINCKGAGGERGVNIRNDSASGANTVQNIKLTGYSSSGHSVVGVSILGYEAINGTTAGNVLKDVFINDLVIDTCVDRGVAITSGASNVVIDGFSIDNITGVSAEGILIESTEDFKIINGSITNVNGAGIRPTVGTYALLDYGSRNGKIDKVTFDTCNTGYATSSVATNKITDVSISNCIVTDCTDGIDLYYTENHIVRDNIITDCTTYGILLPGTGVGANVNPIILNNICQDNGTGIRIASSIDGGIIRGNDCQSNTIDFDLDSEDPAVNNFTAESQSFYFGDMLLADGDATPPIYLGDFQNGVVIKDIKILIDTTLVTTAINGIRFRLFNRGADGTSTLQISTSDYQDPAEGITAYETTSIAGTISFGQKTQTNNNFSFLRTNLGAGVDLLGVLVIVEYVAY